MRRIKSITIILLFALGLMLPINMAFAGGTIFYSPTSKVFGYKFSEWSAQWEQYVLSFPASENPLFDITGERCVVGQHGPVWFLMGSAGGAVTRTCSIPEGKALFFPVINIGDANVDSQTAAELRAESAPCIDVATDMSMEVDGILVQKWEKKARVKSTVFEVTIPENNLFGIDPGTYSPAIADGYYVMLKPLSVGEHTVRIQGMTPGCPFVPGGWYVDVTYNLTIVPVDFQ